MPNLEYSRMKLYGQERLPNSKERRKYKTVSEIHASETCLVFVLKDIR